MSWTITTGADHAGLPDQRDLWSGPWGVQRIFFSNEAVVACIRVLLFWKYRGQS